jgi:hypothetical protein
MNKRRKMATAVAAASMACALLTGMAASAPTTNFTNTIFFKRFAAVGDDPGARAGFELNNLAFPASTVAAAQQLSAAEAFDRLASTDFEINAEWQGIGPSVGTEPGPVTFTGAPGITSGRVTSLAISPRCEEDSCTVLVAAAGGGIWKTRNAFAPSPSWRPTSSGLPTNAIGALLYDPTDRTGSTVYVGTGEQNGSSDSEAGLGLYKSTDGGEHWKAVPGSFDVAHDRAIGAIAVDPIDPRHIWIGTAVARHGSSGVNGGRFTPPGAPQIGLYESTNGGLSFSLVFSVASDTVNPASPNGSDFFRGGVSKIQTYRPHREADSDESEGTATQIYFSVFDYGLYRSTVTHSFEQVFASAGGGLIANSLGARTEFALVPMGRNLRVYLGDTDGGPANFYRTDNANVGAGTLLTGGTNGGWMTLSSPTPGTPGFSSFDFCQGQCSYDMFVASPPGKPDTVWLGGSMQYGELFGPSNGRAVVRSTNAGVSFTDMTDDAGTPAPIGMHPDQHALVFLPGDNDSAIIGSDGGVVRTSSTYANASAECATRGLKGADLADCQLWLSVIPKRISTLNAGLNTLQFQGITVNPQDPRNDVMGGTQDNGTWTYDGKTGKWFETIGGDGGQSAINPGNPAVRIHTFFNAQLDVNFQAKTANEVLGWDFISDPLLGSKEAQSFYVPLISDPTVANTFFVGLQHVWRTQDNGGPQADLDKHCNEFFGDHAITCGDWVTLGGPAGTNKAGDLTGSIYGATKGGSYVVAIARGNTANAPMWIATRRGRLFISSNANTPNPADVAFVRIDTDAQPRRFISGIAIDPENPKHAFVSFSGYDAYTPTTPGHVFEVTYNPDNGTAQWKDLSANLGDQPITGIAYDGESGLLFAATDFGVLVRAGGAWGGAAPGLPPVAVYELTLDQKSHLLYAATHGRGIYRLDIED